jgi:hypothetical protein
MRSIVVSVAIALLAPSLARAQSQGQVQLPPGWKMARRTDGVAITPPDLRAGEVFVVTMMPEEEPGGRSLRDWMIAKVKVDSPRQGRVVEQQAIQSHATGSLLQPMSIETRRGERLLLLYIAAPSPRQKFQLVRVLTSPDKEFYGPLMATAARIISGQPPDATAARERRPAREVERDPEPGPRSRKPAADPTAAFRTEPGRGIKAAEIEAVMAEMEIDMGMYAAGITTMGFEPVLLLKSGEYCRSVELPAADMDVAAHKRARPDSWGKWRRRGGRFQRTDSDGHWIDAKWERRLTPARRGEQMSGTYSRIGGGGNTGVGGDVSIATTSEVTFLPGRRFRWGKFASTTFGGSSGVSGVATNESDEHGTYNIEPGAIEFRYSDGRVERWAMHWGDAEGKGSVFFNRSLYTRPDQK